MTIQSEHQEQTALFNILALYEDKYSELKWIFAIPNGGKRHISVAKKMKAEGVKAGVWDIFVSSTTYTGFYGMFIEMKVKPNKLTENQKAFRDALKPFYRWEVCYSAIEACHAIGDYLGIVELQEVN